MLPLHSVRCNIGSADGVFFTRTSGKGEVECASADVRLHAVDVRVCLLVAEKHSVGRRANLVAVDLKLLP